MVRNPGNMFVTATNSPQSQPTRLRDIETTIGAARAAAADVRTCNRDAAHVAIKELADWIKTVGVQLQGKLIMQVPKAPA